MAGIEQLTPDNHSLYRRVQHLINLGRKYEAICDDIGLIGPHRVRELCEWFIEYRTPKHLRTSTPEHVLRVPVKSKALLDKGVRLQTWQKQKGGAREALNAIEAERA